MFTKRVLAIHDLCSFGRCSLTAVVPVISAMGFQVCPLPTTLSSNNITYQTCYSSVPRRLFTVDLYQIPNRCKLSGKLSAAFLTKIPLS